MSHGAKQDIHEKHYYDTSSDRAMMCLWYTDNLQAAAMAEYWYSRKNRLPWIPSRSIDTFIKLLFDQTAPVEKSRYGQV